MIVVFSVLELFDHFSDQDYNQLADSVQITLTQVQVELNLAVKGVEAHIDQTFDLHLTKEMAQGSVFS